MPSDEVVNRGVVVTVPPTHQFGGSGDSCGHAWPFLVTQWTDGSEHSMPSEDAKKLGSPFMTVPSAHQFGGSGDSCGHAWLLVVMQCSACVWHCLLPSPVET